VLFLREAHALVKQLVDLALVSTPRQFEIFARILTGHGATVKEFAAQDAAAVLAPELDEKEKDRLARRKANAILLLRNADRDQPFWSALAHGPDPRLRSFLIHHLQHVPTNPDAWLDRPAEVADPGTRAAIVLVLGGDAVVESTQPRDKVIETLLHIYRKDTDSGVHGAADWTLRRLGSDAQVAQAVDELSKLGMRPGYHWYVSKSKLTMVIIDKPGRVQFGSPPNEPGRDKKDETQWIGNVNWSFAISDKEITQAQYRALVPEHREFLNEIAPTTEHPANAMPWFDAMEYCRRLSVRDEIPESEIVVPSKDFDKSEYPSFLAGRGYRLPLEVEWEVACRAGSVTPRFFGYAPDLLSSYCYYIANSGGTTQPVGTAMPNQLGIFDMVGNVAEWCAEIYVQNREFVPDQVAPPLPFPPTSSVVVRGNEFVSSARMVRTANRFYSRPDVQAYARGIRVVHTVQEPNKP